MDKDEIKRIQAKKTGEKVQHSLSLARTDPRKEEEEPATEAEKKQKLDLKLFRRLFSYTKPYRARRNWLLFCVIARSIQLPLVIWALAWVIDNPIMNGDLPGILWGTAGFLALALVTQLTMHFRQRLALDLGEDVVFDMRLELYEHLMGMPMSFFNRTRLGSMISRITSDIEAVRVGVQNVVFVTLVQTGQMLGSAVLMAVQDLQLFMVVLAVAPILYFINRYFQPRIGQSSRDIQESFSRVTASIAETVKGIRVTQGFAREQVNAGLFRRLVTDHAGYNMGLARNVALYLPLLTLSSQAFTVAIVIIGGYWVLTPGRGLDAGDLGYFFLLANLFFSPITHLGQQFTMALSAMAGAERLFRMLDTKPDWQDAPDAVNLPRIRGEVEFREVHFQYEPEKPVLHGISFRAQPGQSIALVGHTGSGKSSIINLLCKFWLPKSGEILIDGHDITKVTGESLHRQLGLVLQSNFLFSGSVMENIRLGRLDATDEEVVGAVRSLNCLDLVDAMPSGFATQVGEKGSGLSLGQQQIVCFARAMLADPRILILDEATASVDTMTEARLQEALKTLLEGRTSFVVAHRLSTIRQANEVLVLDHGHIIERGTHAELLRLDGTYCRLYRQFANASTA